MIAALKFIHISAIALWSAGLISLPGLYVQRAHVENDDALYRLQTMVRFAYVAIISPAAFIAISSGIGLIFLRETFVPWFSLKLAFVAVLVMVHVLTGLVIIRLFRDGEVYPAWRFVVVTVTTCLVVVAILFTVLAKPHLEMKLPAVLAEPGGLKRLAEDFIPWMIP